MDFGLSDEQRLIKNTAREFTDREIVERSRENARNHHFDLDIVKKIAGQGYLGAIVPQEYGGAGLDYVTYGLIVEEIGRGDSSIRTVTLRDRDSLEQERFPIGELGEELERRLRAPWHSPKLGG